MADPPTPPRGAPRRPQKEYEDPHFHDEDEVAPPPADDDPLPHHPQPRPTHRTLPPPRRRFHED